MKTLTIKQVMLTEEQYNERCANCVLNNDRGCELETRSWLISTMEFKSCDKGYNYQRVEA